MRWTASKSTLWNYLLKPINYNEFLTASRKAFEWFELKHQANPSREEDFIYVKSDYKLVQIRLEDILYIEGLKDYLKIYTENDPRPVLTLISMKSMEERLPSPDSCEYTALTSYR